MTFRQHTRLDRRKSRSGYVLLTTLLIVAMVCMLTVGLARHSMNLATASLGSQRQLQEKWGIASSQRFAIVNRSKLLNERFWDPETELWSLRPVRQSKSTFLLGDIQFTVNLEDESAKLNINHSFRELGRQKAMQQARKLSGADQLKIKLRPLPNRRRRGTMEDPFESLDQIFVSPSSRISPNDLFRASKKLTCWGKQLNYRTADDDVIIETCKPLIGSILARKLLEILRSTNATEWERDLTGEGANDQQIQKLRNVVGTRSFCQSVWVTAAQEHRQRTSLAVREEVTESVYRVHSFSW